MIADELNPKQISAVTHFRGPIFVVAGPGTGKTKIITHRIAHLIRDHSIAPDQILAVTFTNKAAQEMRDRVQILLDQTQSLDVWIDTFHAFAVRILRDHGDDLNSNFVIFDQETQAEIIAECLRELRKSPKRLSIWLIREVISSLKYNRQSLLDSHDQICLINGKLITDPQVLRDLRNVLALYDQKLRNHNAFDFDDLLLKMIEMLTENSEILAKIRVQIRFILVDEYHDVNEIQYQIVKMIADPEKNVMIVADEDQSIYRWRGADAKSIRKFIDDFQPKVIELEDHYRCQATILQSAQSLIRKNNRVRKTDLRPLKPHGNKIFHYRFNNTKTESKQIANIIRKLVNDRGYSLGEIAMLYRKHEIGSELENDLIGESIPFQRVKNENVEMRSRPLIAFLNFVRSGLPNDFEIAINFPREVIDDLTMARLKFLSRKSDLPFVDFLRQIDRETDEIGVLTRNAIRDFFDEIAIFKTEIENLKMSEISRKLFELIERKRSIIDTEILQKLQTIEIPKIAVNLVTNSIRDPKMIRISVDENDESKRADQIFRTVLKTYFSIELDHAEKNDRLEIRIDKSKIEIADFEWNFPKKISADLAMIRLCQSLLCDFDRPRFDDIIIYDLETIGNDPKNAKIIEIAAIRLSLIGSPLQNFHQLVKPIDPIPKSSSDIHGITNEMVADQPPIENALPKFLSFVQDRILIGHNIIEFDNVIIDRELSKNLDLALTNPSYDTFLVAKKLYPRESVKVSALIEKFKIPHGELHRAEEDVRVTHEIFLRLIDETLKRRELSILDQFLPDQNRSTQNLEAIEWREIKSDFLSIVERFEKNSDRRGLTEFLDHQKLINNFDETEIDADKITLMTIHAAKGLEFPIVFILGMEQGTFPIKRWDTTPAEIEEERRLFYVGMTRAKDQLYLTSVRDRGRDSMFLRELDPTSILSVIV